MLNRVYMLFISYAVLCRSSILAAATLRPPLWGQNFKPTLWGHIPSHGDGPVFKELKCMVNAARLGEDQRKRGLKIFRSCSDADTKSSLCNLLMIEAAGTYGCHYG